MIKNDLRKYELLKYSMIKRIGYYMTEHLNGQVWVMGPLYEVKKYIRLMPMYNASSKMCPEMPQVAV